MNKKRKMFFLIFSCTLMFSFFIGLNKINASVGYWCSDLRVDINGISETGTTYAGGAGNSHPFLLKVAYSEGGLSVGSATKTIPMNSGASHKCWGDPFTYKLGIVNPNNGNVSHLPWFDV